MKAQTCATFYLPDAPGPAFPPGDAPREDPAQKSRPWWSKSRDGGDLAQKSDPKLRNDRGKLHGIARRTISEHCRSKKYGFA